MAVKKFSDVEMIAAINEADGNIAEAARSLDVTRAAVVKRKALLPEGALITDLKEFKVKRGDVFADLQLKAIGAITPKKLESCSAQQLATIVAILYDKERLEAGKSTENVAHEMSQNLSAEDRAYFAELQKKRTAKLVSEVSYDD